MSEKRRDVQKRRAFLFSPPIGRGLRGGLTEIIPLEFWRKRQHSISLLNSPHPDLTIPSGFFIRVVVGPLPNPLPGGEGVITVLALLARPPRSLRSRRP